MIKKNRRGMSLTEMMVVIAMMGVIFSLGAQIMIQFNRYMSLSKVRINLQRDARVIFSIINRNLRQAKVSTVTLPIAILTISVIIGVILIIVRP